MPDDGRRDPPVLFHGLLEAIRAGPRAVAHALLHGEVLWIPLWPEPHYAALTSSSRSRFVTTSTPGRQSPPPHLSQMNQAAETESVLPLPRKS